MSGVSYAQRGVAYAAREFALNNKLIVMCLRKVCNAINSRVDLVMKAYKRG